MSEGDFHWALLASAYQDFKGACASGYLVQKARRVEIAMIRIPYYDTNTVSNDHAGFDVLCDEKGLAGHRQVFANLGSVAFQNGALSGL